MHYVWFGIYYLHIIQFVNIGDADDGPGLAMSGSWENVTTFAACFNIIIIIIILSVYMSYIDVCSSKHVV